MILLWGRLLIRCSFSYITVIILRCCSLLCQVDKLAIKWSILVGTSLLHLPRSHLSGCASLARSVIIVLTSRSYGSTFWLCHFDFPWTTTVWLFPQSLSHGDTLFAASLADRKVCPFIIIFSPFFRFCRRTHKTFVRSHTHTRPPPKIGRPPNTRPKKDDDNPFTLFCFFLLFNLTLISSAVWYGETELGFTCALTPDCQRLHARPPDFPEFSLSTWVRRRRVRAKDTDRIRRRPFHFRFGRGSHGLLSVSACASWANQLSGLAKAEENFTFHCVLESPTPPRRLTGMGRFGWQLNVCPMSV